ncbi:MAG: serine/threonine-protein phosphatase, partial [Deltaproteobacteria bacterium]|nr:serine/threonine-protein phosphatase [Deltaproteobacteria bacterium]
AVSAARRAGPEDLVAAVEAAHRAVARDAGADPARAGMGCTLVAALAAGPRLHVVHAGDARCYLLREGDLRGLTRDHSAVAELGGRAAGLRHVVTRAVGVALEAGPEYTWEGVERGDRVLLCSDGLWGPVPAGRIEELLRESTDPRSACEALIEAALERGGPDNVTAVVAFRED